LGGAKLELVGNWISKLEDASLPHQRTICTCAHFNTESQRFIDVHLITDSVDEAQVESSVQTWDARGTNSKSFSIQTFLKPHSNTVVMSIPASDTIDIVSTAVINNGEHQYQNVLILRKFKDLPLRDPGLTIEELSLISLRTVKIQLKCVYLAAFVLLQSPMYAAISIVLAPPNYAI
jgi:hypothetical protein